ncbi:hypothetical protein CSKR_201000 [Clonorchis sinensis]|uniref:Uncharacterized protein n=1 Tax=Clonorchis sinensis TaxID=79923 RepID=A0A8T1MKW8_CLOSI|nr:hypothetical protein CSKR_201000 [Clonorchis sinensis]
MLKGKRSLCSRHKPAVEETGHVTKLSIDLEVKAAFVQRNLLISQSVIRTGKQDRISYKNKLDVLVHSLHTTRIRQLRPTYWLTHRLSKYCESCAPVEGTIPNHRFFSQKRFLVSSTSRRIFGIGLRSG